jgi:hypothetical protein
MDSSAVSASRYSPAPARPQARTDTDFAAVFAAARTAAAAPARSPLLLTRVILPTRQNVQQLASELGAKLTSRLSVAGLARTPAVGLSVDESGAVRVSGERGDLAAVERAVTSDEGLQRLIRATSAIASHAYDMENGGRLEAQRAYRLSSDPQEIVAHSANQSAGRQGAATSISYCGGAVSVAANGETWAGG